MAKPRVCLNMIVKNEAHIIEETLNNMLPYICYYVINDTGSTDGTPNVITNFFKKHNIDGVILHHEFRTCKCHGSKYKKYSFFHFGWNRSYALAACKGRTEFDYIWVIDADDIIVGDFKYPEPMTADYYNIIIGNDFTYERGQIFKNGLDWKYKDALHEYISCDVGLETLHNETITGNYYLDSRRLGARSQDKDKYLRDALVFEELIKNKPDKPQPRRMFYMAQSYFDYGKMYDHYYLRKGIETYQKRIDMGVYFWEEHYYSYYKVAEGLQTLGEDWKTVVEPAYILAHTMYNMRSEPLYEIGKYYMNNKKFKKASKYFEKCINIPYPTQCKLFIQKSIYDYDAAFQYSLSAFYSDEFITSYLLCKKLLNTQLPLGIKTLNEQNIKFSIDKLKNTEKDNIILYTGNVLVSLNDIKLTHLLEVYNKKFNIYIVGKYPIYSNLDNVYHTTMRTISKYKIKISSIILYDNVDLLDMQLSKVNQSLTSVPLVLYMPTSHIKYWFSGLHGCYFTIHNNVVLSNLIKKLNCIIVYDNNVNSYVSGNMIVLNNTYDHAKLFNFKKQEYTVSDINKCQETGGYELVYHPVNNNLIKLSMFEECVNNISNNLKTAMLYYYVREAINNRYYDQALQEINKLKNNNYFQAELARIYYLTCEYKKSFELAKKLLDFDMIDDNMRTYVEDIMDSNVEYLKDSYLVYPKNKIGLLKLSSGKSNIILSMTTCKRFDLFEKTINSFINCCDINELKLIDTWLVVDDNSSQEDRTKMKDLYPFITFIYKSEFDKGHCKSMNIIRNYVLDHNFNYCIHMEDDFHFMKNMKYVSDSLAILKSNSNYGQVLFNRNYAEVEMVVPDKRIPGGYYKKVNNIRYLEHEYYKSGTREYSNFIEKHSGYGTNAYWPHFSFRPSMVSCNVYRTVGAFSNTPHFERTYAEEYVENGFISTFFDQVCCIHIGKKTWEQNDQVKNSYALNQVDQFVNTQVNKISLHVIRTNDDFSKWAGLKNKIMKEELFTKFEVIKVENSDTTDYKELFIGNTFNYQRNIKNTYVTHFNIWSRCPSEYCMIINDNIEIVGNIDFSGLKDNLYKLTDGKISSGYIIKKAYANGILHGIFNNILTEDFDELFNIGYTQLNFAIDHEITKDMSIDQYLELDGYEFYSQMDSYGGDLMCAGSGKSVLELKEICDKRKDAIGFNTNGWIKKVVCDEKDMIGLYQSTKPCEGLYVKIK